MKKLNFILSGFLFLIISPFSVIAQEHSWRTPEDFIKDTSLIKHTVKWLEKNPFPENPEIRKEEAKKVMRWFEGAPVTVYVDDLFITDVMYDYKFKYKDIVAPMFIFGKGLYLLEHPFDGNEVAANIHGIKSMLVLYEEIKKSEAKAKSKSLEFFEELHASDKLESYVKNKLSSRN